MVPLLKLTVFRGMLGFLQVMGLIFVAAGVQKWSQSFATQVSDVICSTSSAATEEPTLLAENEAAMKRMTSAIAVKAVGDIDHDFVSMMAPHDRGAIDMTRAVPRYGNNEKIEPLAQQITTNSKKLQRCGWRSVIHSRSPGRLRSV